MPEAERQTLLRSLTDEEAAVLAYDWRFWARPAQLPPEGNWQIWLLNAGRGFGKTRSGAEFVRERVEGNLAGRVALIAATAPDARDIMVEGESGLLAISPPWFRPHYEPSKRRLTWPNGAIATTYSADEPDRLRGPQHDLGWCDELATWRYPDAWDQFLFGLRLGKNPQCVVTSTPKRVKLIRELFKDPTCVITGGSTYDNIQNLARPFIERIVKRYEGTTLGRQELHAHLLEDVEGAMWKREQIETFRIPKAPDLVRIVVAIDPAVTSSEDSDETGIVVAGIGADGHGYVLADESLRATPLGWASRAVTSYLANKADRIIGEANNGGDLIEQTIRTVNDRVSYTKVTASRGKQTRAEPVAALYEQGRVHHVGQFAYLEDEMCSWVPGDASPNRMDALVWALTELMVKEQDRMVVYPGA